MAILSKLILDSQHDSNLKKDLSKCLNSPKPLKIFFHVIDATGHQNACIGLAQFLAKRGHKIYFLTNIFFRGQFIRFGFEEILLHRNSSGCNDVPVDPVLAFAKQLLNSGRLGPGGKTTLDRLKAMAEAATKSNVFQSMYDTCVDFNPQIARAICEQRPDLICLDHFFVPPAILQSNVQWLYLASGNPIPIFNSSRLPPPHSGYPTDSDPKTWQEFINVLHTQVAQKMALQQKLNERFGFNAPLPSRSEKLHIYACPEELDYGDVITVPSNCIRVDTYIRETPEIFQLPKEFGVLPNEKLIYFSLGSMGSIDVDLMKRIVAILGTISHKFIVSKGPKAAEFDLPANCWGKANLPQTKILPVVDLVITHGGNNTVTESFYFGKPMVVLPLFADQFDNAQRIHEKGFGIRLEPYTFVKQELIDAIDRLLTDDKLNERLQAAVKRIKSSNSREKACQKIEKITAQFQKQNGLK